MGATTTTTYMKLPNPVPGVDPGPDYAQNLQSCIVGLDQHNHSPPTGGQPITPSGLNISANLPFLNNFATQVAGITFNPQTVTPPNNTIQVQGVDLYFFDGSGNSIQMTSGGSVLASSTGLSGGTAKALFSSNVLQVYQNYSTLTPGNIAVGSVVLQNNTAGSQLLTLSPPNSFSTYSIVLPALPTGSTKIVSMDTSGNMSALYEVDNATIVIASNVIKVPTNGIQQSNLQLRTIGTTAPAGGVALSASTGNFSTSSSTPVAVNYAFATLTTTGRPVFVGLVPDGNTINESALFAQATSSSNFASLDFALWRGITQITLTQLAALATATTVQTRIPPGAIFTIDTPSAGTYLYSCTVNVSSGLSGTAIVNYCKLVAYEI